jgi:hypothetical protein
VHLALQWGNVGMEALLSGDMHRAREAFDKQLRLCREQVVTHLAAEGLGGVAAVATRQGDPDRAARLLGAATAIGPVGDDDVNALLEKHFFASARAQLGSERWSESFGEGAELTFDQAIVFALSSVRPQAETD